MSKVAIFAVLAFFAVATLAAPMRPSDASHINDAKHIDFLNSVENTTWVAGKNARFEGMTYGEVRALFGTVLSDVRDHVDNMLPQATYDAMTGAIPADFNSVTNWQGLVHPIRDQQRCGSCWAFSASEVLSDRFSIASKKLTPVLSAEDLVSCDTGDMGCQGGRLASAWAYMTNNGVVTDTCLPYSAGNGTAPACSNKCADGESWTKSHAKTSYAISGVTNMQKDIMANGPIQVAFKVYKSFMSYTSGVYKKKWYEIVPEGGHAVKIVGWGVENGQDYWLVANSWNTSWGLDGYFKIARGHDQCGMETMGPPYGGTPAL